MPAIGTRVDRSHSGAYFFGVLDGVPRLVARDADRGHRVRAVDLLGEGELLRHRVVVVGQTGPRVATTCTSAMPA